MTTMTAAARRQRDRDQSLKLMAGCPSRQVVGLLSEKWVTLVLHGLAAGPLRRGELSRAVPAASQKMLTQTLRGLEHNGILTRTVIPGVPACVEYELTALGESLLDLVRSIRDWADRHVDEINAARADAAGHRVH